MIPAVTFGQPDKVYRYLSEVSNADEVYILHLRGKRLKAVPQEVYAMHNLRELNLRGNRIAVLSDSIALLQNLEIIELSYGRHDAVAPVGAVGHPGLGVAQGVCTVRQHAPSARFARLPTNPRRPGGHCPTPAHRQETMGLRLQLSI